MKSREKHIQIFVEDVQLCLDFGIREEEADSSPSSPELYLKTVVPQFVQLKECRVCIRNLKTMSDKELKKYGAVDLKKMLRKYEKRKKCEMSNGVAEKKSRKISSESSFSSRNGSGHKSSKFGIPDNEMDESLSALHNSMSWKNKFIGSDFDVFTYKVNRCKVKNCKLKICIGYHGSYDRRRDPNVIVYKPTLCNYISSESSSKKCPRGDSCPLSHSLFEVRYHPNLYKMYNCKEFKEGYCEKGNFCENIHKSGAEPHQTKPKKTVSKSDKVVSKVNVGTVDFTSSSSLHLDNSCDSKHTKDPSQEMPVMHSNTTSSIDIIPKPSCQQNSFKEVSLIKPKLSSSTVSNGEGSAYLEDSSKRKKTCQCCADDLFLRCFEYLLVIKDFLSGFGEWVSDIYRKINSSEWKNVCMGEYLSSRENCLQLYKIYELLSSDNNAEIGVDNSKIKKSHGLVKRAYYIVYNIRKRKLYMGIDVNSLAKQTLGQTYNAIFKNVRNILTVTGKPKVENIVVDRICKKILEKQIKIKISLRKKDQNSSNERICTSKDPVEGFSKVASSGYDYEKTMYESGKNQSVDKREDTAVNLSGHVSNTLELLADDFCEEIPHRNVSPDFLQKDEGDRNKPPASFSKKLDETVITKESSVSKPPTGNFVDLGESARMLSKQHSEGPFEKCEGLKKVALVLETPENAPCNELILDMTERTDHGSVCDKKSALRLVSPFSKETDLKCTFAKSTNHIQSNTSLLNSGQDEDIEQHHGLCASEASFDTSGLPSDSVKTPESNLRELLSLLPETYHKDGILRSQPFKSSATSLKLPASNKLNFCNDEKFSRNSEIREAIDDKTVCGVPIQKMIDNLVLITLDLTYTQICENVEKFLKYTDPGIDRKIVSYICRKVCRENIKQLKKEKIQGQNCQDQKRRGIGISIGNTEISNKEKVFQNSIEGISDENISQTDLNIPLCFNLSKNEATCKEGQSTFLTNPVTKPLISEEDLIRGMEWEAPEFSECNIPKREIDSPIYIPDSPDCEIIASPNPYQRIPKIDPDLVVLPNSPVIERKKIDCPREKGKLSGEFTSPNPYQRIPKMDPDLVVLPNSPVIGRKEIDNFREKEKLSGEFSSRRKEGSSEVRYPHSTCLSKRKGTLGLDNVTEVKRSRPGNRFETCIIIPSSPEDNFD